MVKRFISKMTRIRLSLRFLISLICILTITTAGSLIAYKSLRALYEGSLRDAWTILFLDLESQARSLGENIVAEADRTLRTEPKDAFELLGKNMVRSVTGNWQGITTLDDLGIDSSQISQNSDAKYLFTSIDGDTYFIRPQIEGAIRKLSVFNFKLTGLSDIFKLNEKQTVAYIANRSSRLLFTNTGAVTPKNIIDRPLVAAFITAPFSQGQSEFEIGNDSLYGFHQEIKLTNLILFAEKSKRRAMAIVYSTFYETLKVVVFILVMSIFLLQIPISLLTRPIRRLAALALDISKGNLNVSVQKEGFGEMRALTAGFATMIVNLRERDRAINTLNDQKIQKIKLENELKVASTIQERFLFKPNLPKGLPLTVSAVYQPATQVAGDWYGVHCNDAFDETIFAIVDITGHGVASAMMTPIISVIFYEDIKQNKAFDLQNFIDRCNSALFAFGEGKCTATAIAMKINHRSKQCLWVNVAHPAAMFVDSSGRQLSAPHVKTPNLLGAEATLNAKQNAVVLGTGDRVLIYSDGLSSPVTSRKFSFSRREILKCMGDSMSKHPDDQLATLLKALSTALDSEVEDDLCAIIAAVE